MHKAHSGVFVARRENNGLCLSSHSLETLARSFRRPGPPLIHMIDLPPPPDGHCILLHIVELNLMAADLARSTYRPKVLNIDRKKGIERTTTDIMMPRQSRNL
jgi:hypothetical protein